MKFRYAEEGPTADLTIDAWGDSLTEAFGNVALAMFNAMTQIDKVNQKVSRIVEVKGEDLGLLLFNFLDELLYVHEVDLLVFSRFDIKLFEEEMRIWAECWGEHFDLKKHQQGIAIKAVTFHKMNIQKSVRCWHVRVVLDT